MMDFQQKRKVRKMLYSRLTILVLAVMVFFLARATYHIYETEEMSAADYAAALKNYDDLKAQESALNADIGALSATSGQEEEIRSKFSVAKPGETVVVVVSGTDSAPRPAARPASGLWQRFLDMFK